MPGFFNPFVTQGQFNLLARQVASLSKGLFQMSVSLTNLQAEVSHDTALMQILATQTVPGIVTVIQGLQAQIDALKAAQGAGDDSSALDAMDTQLQASREALQAAVATIPSEPSATAAAPDSPPAGAMGGPSAEGSAAGGLVEGSTGATATPKGAQNVPDPIPAGPGAATPANAGDVGPGGDPTSGAPHVSIGDAPSDGGNMSNTTAAPVTANPTEAQIPPGGAPTMPGVGTGAA